jgi:hypothetical protein
MSRDEIEKIVKSGLPFIIIGSNKKEYHLYFNGIKLITINGFGIFGNRVIDMVDSLIDGRRKLIDWFEPDLIMGTNTIISYIPIREIVSNPCKCSNIDLMKNGCTCGSIQRYKGGL